MYPNPEFCLGLAWIIDLGAPCGLATELSLWANPTIPRIDIWPQYKLYAISLSSGRRRPPLVSTCNGHSPVGPLQVAHFELDYRDTTFHREKRSLSFGSRVTRALVTSLNAAKRLSLFSLTAIQLVAAWRTLYGEGLFGGHLILGAFLSWHLLLYY